MASYNRHYRAALQPLIDRACTLQGHARRRWLDDLRSDCPVVTRDLEALLRELHAQAPAERLRA